MGVRASVGLIAAAFLTALVLAMIVHAPIASSQVSPAPVPSASSQDYSFASQGISCSGVGDTGYGSCFATGNLLGGGYGYGGCLVNPGASGFIPSVGMCYFLNESFAATFYFKVAGNGQIVRSPISGTVPNNPIPVISDVINTNNKFSPYLITCPVSPQPTNSIEYISDPGTFIAGNRCLASILPLLTSVSLTTQVIVTSAGFFYNLGGGGSGGPAPLEGLTQSYSISGFAKGSIKNLGFSGQTSLNGGPYNLSGSYNTKSYIFQPINSSPQQGLWTWTADYANLGNINLGYLHVNYDSTKHSTTDNLNAVYLGVDLGITEETYIPTPAPIFVICSFPYTFILDSKVTNLANANVPIPIYNTSATAPGKNYLKIGQYIYSPVKAISNPTGNSCFKQMLAGGPGCKLQGGSIITTIVGGTRSVTNWLKIGTNATAYYGGQTYNNLPVYLNASNSLDINRELAYYGAVIGCQPLYSYGYGNFFGFYGGGGNPTSQVRCKVVIYIPQVYAQNVNGNPNPTTAASFIADQLHVSGSGLALTPASSYGGGGFFGGGGPVNSACSGFTNPTMGYGLGFTGTYDINTANSMVPGYNLNYCVTPGGYGGFGGGYGGYQNPAIQQQICRGAGLNPNSCALYVGISSNPLNSQALGLGYMVPINSGSTQVLLSTNSITSIDFANVLVFPYFTYNATIPSTFSQFTPASYLNLSYAVYSPNNYASTTNAFGVLTTPVEPYNLFSGSGLLANYSALGSNGKRLRPSEMVDFPISISAGSANTYYDEFPVVVGGIQIKTSTVIPLSTATSVPAVPAASVTSPNSITPANLVASLNLKYPANTIVTLAGTTLTSSDLDACSADFIQGGSCFGDLEITGTTILQDNLFVFGNINIDSGATLITNGYSIITSGTVSPTSSVLARPASVASITDANLDEALAAGYTANSIIQVTADIDQNSGLPACPNDIVSGYCLGETNFTAPATLRGNLFIFGNAINIEPGVVIQTNGHAIITNGVVSDPGSVIGGYKDSAAAVNNHGTLGFTNITNPAFITETPNGFIYIINYSAGSGWSHLGIHSTTTSYLFKLKYIPTGDYNYSVYQPKQFTQQTRLAPWMIQAQNYFRGSLLVQTPSLYVLSASLFSQTNTPNWCLLSLCIGSTSSTGSSPGPFLPMAAQADYQGDLFLVGAPLPSFAGFGTGTFTLGEVSASGVITVDNAVSISGGYGFVPSDEMAVSPGGEYVYLANASFPNINIYSTKGGTFTYVGNIPLSYSNSSYNMNIIAYLAHGGPYNNKNVQTEFQRTSRATTTLNDISTFHRPMEITDVGGTLFVLDAWTFGPDVNNEKGTNSNSNPAGYTGSIWMLRAFEAGGNNIVTELPIGYSSNKTIVPTSPVPQQVSPFAQPQTFTYWPPYGWPLTENLSFESQYWTICEYNGIGGCNAYGTSPSGLSSVGPQISLLGTPYPQTVFGSQPYDQDFSNPTVGISSDFAGDIYLLVHDSVAKSPYTELLELKPQVENYTRLDIGTSVPFQCYFSNAISTPDCMTANFISGLYPPLLAMPDSFEFLSGQGSELQYFNIPSGLSSLLPVGAKVSPNTANEFNTGNTGGSPGLYNCLTTNSPDTCGTVGAFTPTSQLRTYINGLVAGYVITPYTITYTNKITYGGFGDGTVEEEVNPESAEAIDPNLCDYTPDPSSGSKTFYKNVVTQLGSSGVNQTIEGGSEYANYYGTQNQYQPNLSDQSLIMPPNITYSMFSNRLFGEIYINQTISPTFAGSISTQLASYLGSSLGSLGSVLSSFTGMGPKVLNATRNYNYAEDVYIQVFLPSVSGGLNPFNTGSGSSLASWSNVLSTGGCSATNICAPAFLAENAIPTNVLTTPSNTLIGANCGGSCPTTLLTSANGIGVPTGAIPFQVGSLAGLSGYYYSSLSTNYLPNNNFTYSATSQTSYFPLFTLFKRMASTYTLGLNLSNTPQIYGYNRLLYTYVDRFNNTIYMPVDVDFANTTMLTLDTPSAVNTLNVNQTQITINGILLYLASNGIWVPPPVGSTVYLYYNTNINFYNTSAISSLASSAGGLVSNLVGYYKWADICAFAPEDSGCVAANPLSTFGLGSLLYGVSGIPNPTPSSLETLASSALESLTNTVTYSPNYASSGQCAPQPNSLLITSQYDCNLYGSSLASLVPGSLLGLPATATGPNGNQQYCVPAYTNGTGTLTSQLGLIGTAATNSSGGFNTVITACGTGSGRIIAQFYGSPSPEPINIAQTILPRSVTPLSANTANDIITPEYNYGFAPNETSSPFQIGSYQLSLGNFYAWIPIIIILILLLASKSALGQSGGLFELFGFSTLASMASGIGSGAGTKGIKRAYRAKQNPPNPIFDRYDDYKKAQSLYSGAGGKSLVSEKMALNKQTGKMEKTGIYTTSVLTFAAWVKAGMPGPATERGNQFPSNLDQVNRYNGKNLSIDRSNFYTFLGLSKVPPDRETAQRAAASQQRMLNMTNPNDPNLDAKKNALKLAQQVAEQNLKPAAAGGGLIAMSTAKQYWQTLRKSARGYVKEASETNYAIISPGARNPSATTQVGAVSTNEELLSAYKESMNDLKSKPESKSFAGYREVYQKRIDDIKTRMSTEKDKKKLDALNDDLGEAKADSKLRIYVGKRQVWNQQRNELQRAWKTVKKQRGINDAPPPPPAPPPPSPTPKPPPLPPNSSP